MKVVPCPICGHTPIVVSESLGKDNGCGYPGKFSYYIKCSNHDCPLSREAPVFGDTDIYRNKNDVYTYLGEVWNEECAKINKLILNRHTPEYEKSNKDFY